MIHRLALRNLLANRWRSLLTVGGIGIAVALIIWSGAFLEGFVHQLIRGATAIDVGQVQVHTPEYGQRPATHHSFPADSDLLENLRSMPQIAAVSPRVEFHGIIGTHRRSRVARLVGLPARRTAGSAPLIDAVEAGRWIRGGEGSSPSREVVLGRELARQLRVEVGDELAVIAEAADGSQGDDLLEVVGILRTGNTLVDRRTAYVTLEEGQFITALGDEIHKIILRTENLQRAEETAGAIRSRLPGWGAGDLAVRPWQEVVPGLWELVQMSGVWGWVLYVIAYGIAGLGILNAQRMSALEREREFGLLGALGVSPGRIFGVVMLETLVLGAAGGLLGGIAGTLLSLYHSVVGLDLSLFTTLDSGFTYMGIAFSERLHFVLNPATVWRPVLIVVVVSVLCGLWPAVQSARVVPRDVLSGRQ